MTKPVEVVAICGLVSLFSFAADTLRPLNVKTGLWQMTETVKWTGLPEQYAALVKDGQTIHYKSCVKAKDLNSNPWAEGSGEKCSWTAVKSDGTDMEVRGTSCRLGDQVPMTADVHGTIHVVDPENGTGTFVITITGGGQTWNGHATYTGKWMNSTCPSNMN